MPKTIMAPLRRVLYLGIILLLVSHLSESSPSPDEKSTSKSNTQDTGEKDDKTEDEQVASKLNLFQFKRRSMPFHIILYRFGIVSSHAWREYSNELPILCCVR